MSSFIRSILISHHDLSRLSLGIRHLLLSSRRRAHTSSTKDLVQKLPQVRTCPPPSCPCAEMPSGLDIKHDKELYGTMPPYSEHVIIRTGRADWGSRIEEEDVGGVAGVEGTAVNFAKSLKMLTGRGGKYHDPDRPVLISNCSLMPSHPPQCLSAHVFPSNLHVQNIGHTFEDHEAFVARFLGDKTTLMRRRSEARRIAHKSRSGLDAAGLPIPKEDLVPPRGSSIQYTSYHSPTILICGHNSRDTRCGILGPLLKAEFDSYLGLGRKIWSSSDYDFNEDGSIKKKSVLDGVSGIRTALVSHIGGHVWAGNVIIYLPRKFKTANGSGSQLTGKGIWYGRVEPRHVEGIVEETFRKGNLIRDLLRGIHVPGSLQPQEEEGVIKS